MTRQNSTAQKMATATVALAAIVAIGGIGFWAVSSTGNTQPDQYGLHYDAGPFSDTRFENCINPGTRNFDGPGDEHFYYPAGQRTLEFRGKDDESQGSADFRAFAANTKAPEGQTMIVNGQATFVLNGDCAKLQEFHEKIGIKYQYPDGWTDLLSTYLQVPLGRAITEATQQFSWNELFFDVDGAKGKWEKYIVAKLPEYVRQSTGGNYFDIQSITLPKPEIPDGLQKQLDAAQENTQANVAQAEINAKALTEAEGAKPWIDRLGVEGYLQRYAIEKGTVQVLPLPYGSPVIAGR